MAGVEEDVGMEEKVPYKGGFASFGATVGLTVELGKVAATDGTAVVVATLDTLDEGVLDGVLIEGALENVTPSPLRCNVVFAEGENDVVDCGVCDCESVGFEDTADGTV